MGDHRGDVGTASRVVGHGARRRLAALLAMCVLGAATAVAVVAPASAGLAPRPFVQVDQGDGWPQYGCGLAADSTIWCWGVNWGSGNFGTGRGNYITGIPEQVLTIGTPLQGKAIASISTGATHACAVTTDGKAACWGSNPYGELGTGSTTPEYSLVAVALKTAGTPLAGKTLKAVEAGSSTTCALATDGTLACWGLNNNDQLGINDTFSLYVTTPTLVYRGAGSALAGQTVKQISGGSSHWCVVTTAGKVACWGRNAERQLGDGTQVGRAYPVALAVAGTPFAASSFAQVSAGHRNGTTTCAVTTTGAVACWGLGTKGQLGNGSTASSAVPVQVKVAGTILAGRQVKQVAVGSMDHACAVTTDGLVSCWGSNTYGQLGIPSPNLSSASSTPVAVNRSGTALAGVKATQISAGYGSCARADDGRIACWGPTWKGVLGNGDTSMNGKHPDPVGVIGTGKFWAFPSNASFVDRAFKDLLGRAPTASERTSWVGKLDAKTTSPAGLVASLRASGDHAANVDPVARLYWAYFVRIPDPSGLTYWVGQKRKGQSLNSISAGFAGSTEFKNRYGALSNKAFVELVYQNVLGRPGEAGGVAFWTGQLSSGAKTRGQVMVGFSESGEYRAKQASSVHAAVLYALLLGRAPTEAEVAGVKARLGAGGTVAAEAQRILDTTAYLTRVVVIR